MVIVKPSIALLFTLTFWSYCSAQHVSGNGVLEALYGTSYLIDEGDFVQSIETDHAVTMSQNSNFWGVGLSSSFNLTRSAFEWDGDIIYYQFVKQRQKASNGDEHEFYGSFLSVCMGGADFLSKNPVFDFMLQFGLNLGNRKYRYSKSGGDQSLYKNFIFAPKAKVEFRMILGRLSLSSKFEGQYDVSKPIWKNKKGPDQIVLEDLSFHGYLLSFGLGYSF